MFSEWTEIPHQGPTYMQGDMWSALKEADLWLFTGNGVVKRNGALVMGAGIAKQVRDRWPGCDVRLGCLVKQGKLRADLGGYVYNLIAPPGKKGGIFQTKINWKNPSTPQLIKDSTEKLVSWCEQHPGANVHLNMPGTGYGKLTQAEVKPILQILPPNVHIWTYR